MENSLEKCNDVTGKTSAETTEIIQARANAGLHESGYIGDGQKWWDSG